MCFVGRRKASKSERSSSADSASSIISTAAIQDVIDKLQFSRFRGSTRENYYAIWKAFNKFFIRLDVKPSNWEDRSTLFVGFLVQNKRKSSTIRSYISAIKAVLKDLKINLNEDRFQLTSLTSTCKLLNDKVHTRLPINKGLLWLIIKEVRNSSGQQPYLSILFSAIFSTMYFGLFRIGEMTTGTHPVRACDVHIGNNKNKMLFVLRTSKTHGTENKPQTVKICSKKSDILGNTEGIKFLSFSVTQGLYQSSGKLYVFYRAFLCI